MSKVRHVLGISGGKDSTALAIYLRKKYPNLEIEYYFCDTGKELPETYSLLNGLESFLGKKIKRLLAAPNSPIDPFDHFIDLYRGFIPSSNARWCTQKLKLEPFERFVGDDPVISYVGIRGDELREGYISKKSNIQSIFPFRKNIWSEDVINKVMNNRNIELLCDYYNDIECSNNIENYLEILDRPLSFNFVQSQKLSLLMKLGIKEFNKVVFRFLKTTDYPLSREDHFPLIENDEILIKEDIFKILKESNVGIPQYYNLIEFEVGGEKGFYNRSRSGCFFCFFQQKIEWVWLYENHNDLFLKAIEYEKEGYTWMQDESLLELVQPDRVKQIKEYHLKKSAQHSSKKSEYLLDILDEEDERGCAACFI